MITQPDKPRGRGQHVTEGPVKSLAATLRLPVLQPSKLARDQFEAQFAALDADIGVVAAYGKILPDWLLATPRLGLINVHASLLPRYRGASPVHRAVINGDAETGVTIMRVVKELDAGPMLRGGERADRRRRHDDHRRVDAGDSWRRALIETLDAIEAGTARETPQDPSARHVRAEARKDRRPRRLVVEPAADPQPDSRPVAVAACLHVSRRDALHPAPIATVRRSAEGAAPGTIVHASAIDGLHVACGEGTAIELVDIQLEGKRVMSARDAMASKALVAGARFSPP